ncbi:MAG: hypothetical protein LKJ88_02840 [Bacilli bacterium]|jgi:hypothetical protein|nr:hypothetical protein [Bacilli bacterium]
MGNVTKAKRIQFLIIAIVAYACYVAYGLFFYAFKIGVVDSWLKAYLEFQAMFDGSLWKSTGGILIGICVIGLLLLFILLEVLFHKREDNGFFKVGKIYNVLFFLSCEWALLAGGRAWGKISQIYGQLFGANSTAYVSAAYSRALKIAFLVMFVFAVLYVIFNLYVILRCLLAKEPEEAIEPAPVEEEKKEEEPKQEDAKHVEEEKPAEEKKEEEPKQEEPKEEEKPAEEPAPAVVAAPAAAVADKKKAFIRVPFPTKLKKSDQVVKDAYKEIKAEILSYGIKSRVTSSGDTFRLHKVKYMKATVAGTKLKLYFKLDPKKYDNTPIPHGDASSKKIYEDVPMVFKVRSTLSVNRAKKLIADMMDEAKIAKKEPKEKKAEKK